MSHDRRQVEDRAVLLDLASALIASGTRVDQVERQIQEVSRAVGHPQVQIAASPTGVFLALEPGGATAVRSGAGGSRLDQAALINEVRLDLLNGRAALAEVPERLQAIRELPHRHSVWGPYVGLTLVGMGICLILQPALSNMLLVGLCSVIVVTLMTFTGRHPAFGALLPLAASFVVALATFGAAQAGFIDGPLRTLICPLAVLLPGALLSTGVAELAAGAMVAGTARLVYGLVQLLLFAVGVLAAAMLVHADDFTNLRVHDLGLWSAPLGLSAIAAGITFSESLGWKLFRWMAPVLVMTYVTQLITQQASSSTGVGAFAGAAVASLMAGLIEWLRPAVPAMVAFLPSFWLLVPGTVGLIGITQVSTGGGSMAVVGVIGLVTAIAMGMLIGSSAAQALRVLRRRRG